VRQGSWNLLRRLKKEEKHQSPAPPTRGKGMFAKELRGGGRIVIELKTGGAGGGKGRAQRSLLGWLICPKKKGVVRAADEKKAK